MSIVDVVGEFGNKRSLLEIDGQYFPLFSLDVIRNIPNIKLRADDMMLVSYQKSGCHWVYEICRMLLQGTTGVAAVSKATEMIEFTESEKLDKLPSPRILNTHIRLEYFPKDVFIQKPKIVYIRRNPKDVVVSSYNHIQKRSKYEGDFNSYLGFFLSGKVAYGSWFDYVLHWDDVIENHSELSILPLTYEDLKEDSIREIKKISEFLGVNRDDDFIQKVADACCFSQMLERHGHIFGMTDGQSNIYRKGEVGDWKNWFTVANNERFDKIFAEKMAGSKLVVKYCVKPRRIH